MLDADHVKEKSGSVGRAQFHVETRIVDENDRDVPTGQVGELVVRGPNVFTGYWGLPEATAEAFRGGWFHTGDMGRMDTEGFITLVDRKKDMIISRGENVYPIEVEQVLYRHPAVREVAVVGVPHAKFFTDLHLRGAFSPWMSDRRRICLIGKDARPGNVSIRPQLVRSIDAGGWDGLGCWL